MREIKFRGQRVDNKEWVHGSYQADVMGEGRHTIIYSDHEGCYCEDEVIPETVGQYTGLKEVYEGDIGWDDHNECYGVVEFSDGNFSYVWENICTDLYEVSNDVDFVGNIHDNPELLEAENE